MAWNWELMSSTGSTLERDLGDHSRWDRAPENVALMLASEERSNCRTSLLL